MDSPVFRTVVFPSFVLTFTVPNEPEAVNLPEVNSASTELSSNTRLTDEFGSNCSRPALAMLSTAEVWSGVETVVEEKTENGFRKR